MSEKLTSEDIARAKHLVRGFNKMLRKLGIICFGFALTALIQCFYGSYISAIFDFIVFLWILNTVRKLNFLEK